MATFERRQWEGLRNYGEVIGFRNRADGDRNALGESDFLALASRITAPSTVRNAAPTLKRE